MLSSTDLVVGYAGQALFGPLQLRLPRARLTCLIGANGAGKSTLIRTLCGMQPPVAGEVHVEGCPLRALRGAALARRLAVVLTDRVEAEALTGFELASLGRYPHTGWGGRLGADDAAIVQQALRQVGAEALAARRVAQMSDGERQRVMVARALAQQPAVLVLDEPTAFLDLPRRIALLRLLRELARTTGIAVLMSTHELELAMRHADRLWLLDGQRCLHAGAPEDLALDGALSRAFAGEALRFDLERGTLVPQRSDGPPVRLEGEGVPGTWARQAIERVGWRVDAQAACGVSAHQGRYAFRDEWGGQVDFDSLGDLAEHLMARTDARESA